LKPNFSELLKVLRKEKPSRPVLFEFALGWSAYLRLAGRNARDPSEREVYKLIADAFHAGGFDYVSAHASDVRFARDEFHRLKTLSLNQGFVITDWESYEKYIWPDIDNADYSRLDWLGSYLPDGMKIMVLGIGGVMENLQNLMGYDNLCYAVYEQPELVKAVSDQIGSRVLKYYQNALEYNSVGILMSNDDWGFNTQTFLSPDHMREYVFPWHKKIVELAHNAGIPAVLHSCGNVEDVFEDIIEDIGYDAKHSFEDNIVPVEESYHRWGGRIAIMGGIDVDYLVRADISDIKKRCRAMLDRSEKKGCYTLGSGNSIPDYVPFEKYLALLECAWERR